MSTFISEKEDDFFDIAGKILSLASWRKVFLLKGDLAAGKTTLVKNMLKHLHIDDTATSPTFSIINEYGSNPKVFHYDIYQKGSQSFVDSGIWQNFLTDGYHLVEWGDDKIEVLLNNIGIDFVTIKIDKLDNKRIVSINE